MKTMIVVLEAGDVMQIDTERARLRDGYGERRFN